MDWLQMNCWGVIKGFKIEGERSFKILLWVVCWPSDAQLVRGGSSWYVTVAVVIIWMSRDQWKCDLEVTTRQWLPFKAFRQYKTWVLSFATFTYFQLLYFLLFLIKKKKNCVILIFKKKKTKKFEKKINYLLLFFFFYWESF